MLAERRCPLPFPDPTRLARLISWLLALLLALWFGLATATPAAAQTPPAKSDPTPPPAATPQPGSTPPPAPRPTATPSPGQPPIGGFNPLASITQQVQQTVAELLASTIRPVRDLIRGNLASQFNFLTVTRPEHTAGLAQVRQFHDTARAIANGALALILIAGGYNLLFRRHLTGDEQGVAPLLGRTILAGLAANTALLPGGGEPQGWVVWFIGLNNALIDATTRTLPLSFDTLFAAGALDPLNPADWVRIGAGLLLALVILAVLMLVLLLWVLQMIVRLALLNLLLALAPLALLLWVLPQTAGWAALWWRLFLPTLFCQFLQVAALGLAARLSSTLYRPAELALAPLMSIATLVLVLKLPGLLGAGFRQGQSLSAGIAKPLVLLATTSRAVGRGS